MGKQNQPKRAKIICEGCDKERVPASEGGIYCKKCVQANIEFFAHPPAGLIEQNQKRIFGKVLSDKEFQRHIQQKDDED